jgi:uncharacterized protein YxeA
MKKHLFSFSAVIIFIFLALASQVNKIHYGAFNYDNRVEDKSDTRNYLEQNDGTRIYGQKIMWKSGLLAKDQIQIDKQKFKISEIRGYRMGDTFFGRLRNEYIKRIVHGKINVYVQFSQVTSTSVDHNGYSRSRTSTRTTQYAQKGEDGSMVIFAGQNDIKTIVSDCPLAVEMIDISNAKIRKAVKKNPDYLNNVFEVYNNDCKPVH